MFTKAWWRSFLDGRVFYSLGDPLAASLIRPDEKITKRQLRTCMLVFSDDPSLSGFIEKPAKKPGKGHKDHIDKRYIEKMDELLNEENASAVAQAARLAIAELGAVEGEVLESTISRFCAKYRQWKAEGRI